MHPGQTGHLSLPLQLSEICSSERMKKPAGQDKVVRTGENMKRGYQERGKEAQVNLKFQGITCRGDSESPFMCLLHGIGQIDPLFPESCSEANSLESMHQDHCRPCTPY